MINIAQIGVGHWGPNILRNLVENKRCNVEMVIDTSEERRRYVENLYPSIRVYNDIEFALNNRDIDAVVVATPTYLHYDIVIRALQAGKHVFVEKPVTTSNAEINYIGKIAKEKNLIVMVGYILMYSSEVRYIKDLINTGILGDIRYIYSKRVSSYVRNDIDALYDIGSHDVGLVQYWLGGHLAPVSVSKQGMSYLNKGFDDISFLNIIYPNNILVHIHVSWLDPKKVAYITIGGSKGTIVFDETAEKRLRVYKDSHTMDIYIKQDEPLKVEMNHFMDCIENKTKCITGIDYASKIIEIINLAGKENK